MMNLSIRKTSNKDIIVRLDFLRIFIIIYAIIKSLKGRLLRN